MSSLPNEPAGPGRGLRLLLIADVRESEGALAAALYGAGMEVVRRAASSAAEVRAALAERGWDAVVLTDPARAMRDRDPDGDQRFLDAIVENLPAMLFVKDAATLSFQRVNRAAEELTGVPREQLLGKTDFDFFPEEEARFFQAKDRDALRGRKLVDIAEEPLETRRGLRWLHSRKVPILGDDGEPAFLLGISEDITDLKQAVEELRGAREAAEAANRAKSDFLANVSHELRTPLTAILGFTELVHDGQAGPIEPEQKRFLGDVLKSSRQLFQLVNDLIDLAGLESGRAQLTPSTFDVQSALNTSALLIRRQAEQKGVAVTVAAGLVPPLTADERRFGQVLHNLLSNATKFTPAGGRIELGARATPDGAIEISVADTGIGIHPEDRDRIFDHFEQLDSTFARAHPGAGLGLALSKRLVEMQGGRIWVESEPGKGSTFRFCLPRTPPEPQGTR